MTRSISGSPESKPHLEGVFVHPEALCESRRVGPGTRIWAFAHILPGAQVGSDCNICDGVFIENDVVVGDRVTIKPGVQLWDGVRIADDVFVGPNATFTNDQFPRSKQYVDPLCTVIGRGASIGANATVLPGLKVGRRAMVGAGSVVTHDVPPNAVVTGNPARITGYVDTIVQPAHGSEVRLVERRERPLVGGARLVDLSAAADMRGKLVAAEEGVHFPFAPRRLFTVYGVPSTRVRGEHAHRLCHQFLIAVAGKISVVLDDGTEREEVTLDTPSLGLHIPPMVWGIQYRYTSDAVLLVTASHLYDPDDYIRDYDQFLAEVGRGTAVSTQRDRQASVAVAE